MSLPEIEPKLEMEKQDEMERSLDPLDWEQARALGHRMIDDAIEYLRTVRGRDVWQPIPGEIMASYQSPIPQEPKPANAVYEEFARTILPYPSGNIHPRFFSWVQGTGTITGAYADFMAAVMNANCAIGDHSAMYIDRQVLSWCKEIMGFPREAGGILVSGGSIANLTALTVARQHALEKYSTKPAAGIRGVPGQLVAYGSTETHQCVNKAIATLGLGSDGFCQIPVGEAFRVNIGLLEEQIIADRIAGKIPFCIIANAGTVNTGAIDNLVALRDLARAEGLWFHVDGAFGALARLVPAFEDELAPISDADSVAFDLHKWMYIPYEVGCALIRDAALQRRTFAAPANYLLSHDRGLASGPDAYSNQGLELSRGFKALKVWMSLEEHGIDTYARQIAQNITQAKYLGELVKACPELELLAEVNLNIVCFRHKGKAYSNGNLDGTDLNAFNKELLIRLQESGIAAPSYTIIRGQYAIRVAITNHRTRLEDMEILVKAVLEIASKIQ